MLSPLITWDSILVPMKKRKTSVSPQESVIFLASSSYFNQLYFKHSFWYTEGQRQCTQEILSGWTYLKFQKHMFTFLPRQNTRRFFKSPHKRSKALEVQTSLSPQLIIDGDTATSNTSKPSPAGAQPSHSRWLASQARQLRAERWGRRRWRVPGRWTGASERHLGGAAAPLTPSPRKTKESPARAGECPATPGAALGSRRGQHCPALQLPASACPAPWPREVKGG